MPSGRGSSSGRGWPSAGVALGADGEELGGRRLGVLREEHAWQEDGPAGLAEGDLHAVGAVGREFAGVLRAIPGAEEAFALGELALAHDRADGIAVGRDDRDVDRVGPAHLELEACPGRATREAGREQLNGPHLRRIDDRRGALEALRRPEGERGEHDDGRERNGGDARRRQARHLLRDPAAAAHSAIASPLRAAPGSWTG